MFSRSAARALRAFEVFGLIAAAFLLAAPVLALDEAAYAVANEPWPEGLGNHRAVVHAEQKADAVLVKIPWRRRDHDPERKQILLVDAASGLRITNVARLHLDRFEGVLAFQPQTAPGDYFVYYLPFTPQPGYGSYTHDYLPPAGNRRPRVEVTPARKTRMRCPRASVVRLEARTEFDSFYPMEVVATPEETQAMLDRSAAFTLKHSGVYGAVLSEVRPPGLPPYLLFPEDRRFPIRMTDGLPLRWVKSGPSQEFRGEALRNEFYVFQIGVWAARTNITALDVEFTGDICTWLNCFNTGGTNWDGQAFHKTINVPQGKVQALWFGVNVPRDAKPGEHQGKVTIRPANAPPGDVELTLKVLPAELADRGDSDPSRLSRLRWLDSTLAATVWPPDDEYPWKPRPNEDRGVHTASDAFGVRDDELFPVSIRAAQQELLSRPMRLVAVRDPTAAPTISDTNVLDTLLSATVNGREGLRWIGDTAFRFADGSTGLATHSEATAEANGYGRWRFASSSVSATEAYQDLRLEIPLRPEVATYFMGLGLPACRTPTNYTWHWTGPYNSFWIGNAHAGLHVKLLGSSYEGPMQNLYHPKPPPSWFNNGKGGVTITNGPKGEVLVQVFTGPFELKAGEERTFDFSLLVTPVKPLDPATHFRERYWHSTHDIPPDVNVINVHHATAPNPFINYPFLAVDKLREILPHQPGGGQEGEDLLHRPRVDARACPSCGRCAAWGTRCWRTARAADIPWLREHLGSGYTTAWYTSVEGRPGGRRHSHQRRVALV